MRRSLKDWSYTFYNIYIIKPIYIYIYIYILFVYIYICIHIYYWALFLQRQLERDRKAVREEDMQEMTHGDSNPSPSATGVVVHAQ